MRKSMSTIKNNKIPKTAVNPLKKIKSIINPFINQSMLIQLFNNQMRTFNLHDFDSGVSSNCFTMQRTGHPLFPFNFYKSGNLSSNLINHYAFLSNQCIDISPCMRPILDKKWHNTITKEKHCNNSTYNKKANLNNEGIIKKTY